MTTRDSEVNRRLTVGADSRLVAQSTSERTTTPVELGSGDRSGTWRPAKENARRPRKLPRAQPDTKRTFFCTNPQCHHGEWSLDKQLVHLGRELEWAFGAIAALDPGSPEALKLTDGVVLRDLSDEECRIGAAERRRAVRMGDMPSLRHELIYQEMRRREYAGTLSPAEKPVRLKAETCGKGHPFTPENTWVDKRGHRTCITCRYEYVKQPKVRAKINKYWRDKRREQREQPAVS